MMTKGLTLVTALLVSSLGGHTLPAEKDVVPVKFAEVPGYTEGAVFDRAGNIYISDVYHGIVYRVTPDVNVTPWAKTGAPNGHRILPDGTHLVCDGEEHAVLHLDADGKVLGKASSECDGNPLRAPNDIALDPKGGFYFTDPGGSEEKNPIGTVHYVDPKGTTHLVASGLAFPNGLLLTPDRKRLLVGESGHDWVLEYPVLAPGRLGPKRVFATLPTKSGDQIGNAPDGMAFDEDGNIFIAHWGMHTIQVLSPEGKLLRSYAAGPLTSSNLAFGGPNMDQLYVTGAIGDEKTTAGVLFRLDLKGVRGRKLIP
jgi:gluconolactonase